MKSTSTTNRLLDKIRTFDALHYHRNFRFLLFSNFIYSINAWMLMLVMSWLAYELTSSAFLVAAFGAARTGPFLLGPFIGTIADRVDRKKFIIVARALQMVFASILAILSSAGLLEFWHLVVIGFLQGLMGIAGMNASSALSMDIVGKEHITNAIALNSIAMDATRIIGPAVGGALVAFASPANCFWMAACFAILSLITLFPMGAQQKITIGRESVWRGINEGFRYVVHNRDTLSVLVITFAANIFIWPAYGSFMPIFAKDNLGLDALGLGIVLTTSGVGALIGAIFIASLGDFNWKGSMFLYGTALWAIFFGSFVLSHSYPVALVLIGLAGLVSSSFMTMQSTIMLILVPEDMRARGLGFVQMSIGVLPFANLALGAVASIFGASLSTAISCALMPLTIIVIAIVFPNLRRLG